MNPYDVLNVRRNASSRDITLAYRNLKEKYDEKNYLGDPYFAKKRLADINEAYNFLSDTKKRAQYDKEHENHTNMHKSSSDSFTPYYNRPKTTKHIHNDAEIAQNKYNNSNPISEDPINQLNDDLISENLSDKPSSDISNISQDPTILFIIFFGIFFVIAFAPLIIEIIASL